MDADVVVGVGLRLSAGGQLLAGVLADRVVLRTDDAFAVLGGEVDLLGG